MVDPPPQLFNFVLLSVISWTPVCFFPLMITVYVPMQSDPFVNAFICFCSRHLGIRYVLEFGPPLLHLHFISSLDFFLWMCGISNLYLSLKVFLWLLLFVKKVQYTYKTKPPENLFCEIKLHKAEWLTESAEGRLNCDKKNWKTQSSRLQMSQTFICWSLFVSVGGVLNYGIEKTSFVTLSLAVFWLEHKC
jgi:hypothetical protein